MLECNAVKSLAFQAMSKKDEFIHIRSDEELKLALEESAARCDRKITDQARYILRMALGLSEEGGERERLQGRTKAMRGTPHKGGGEKSKAG
mgnify:CR=1 FL=1